VVELRAPCGRRVHALVELPGSPAGALVEPRGGWGRGFLVLRGGCVCVVVVPGGGGEGRLACGGVGDWGGGGVVSGGGLRGAWGGLV
jgi:hypothetical protein